MSEVGNELMPKVETTPQPEIKLSKPGILAENLTPQEKLGKPAIDDLIVFGQGPVLDLDTREKPVSGTKQADINVWGKNAARAAGELKKAGVVNKIILTGGKTGGEAFQSEAELMKKILMEEYHVAEQDIVVEGKATNTLENFAYTLNSLEEGMKSGKTVGFLGADFHLARIKLLGELFGINNTQGFSAEQVFRLIAYKTGDQNLHQQLDSLLKPTEDLSYPESRLDWKEFSKLSPEQKNQQQSKSAMKAPTYFETLSGEEKKGIVMRLRGEQQWSRGLQEIPTYWIGYLGYLKSDERLLTVLKNQFNPQLLTQLGIDILEPPDRIRTKLFEYTKPEKRGVPPESWGTEQPTKK